MSFANSAAALQGMIEAEESKKKQKQRQKRKECSTCALIRQNSCFSMKLRDAFRKHCQRHNGPRVLISKLE